MQGASLQGGVIVCQHWRLRRGLGSSEGQAWEAEDVRSGNSVAIKFLQRPSTLDEPARQRFEREARAFGRVRSLHYVQILDQGISERGVPFLVTERLDGEDLGLLLARQPRLDLHEVGAILDQLLRALARLQSLRLVHRDVRPENVFLCEPEDGRRLVKLLDFGFARRPVRVASPGAWQSGAAYWSPEQIATPMRVDHRSDVWAAGVLGYRMLTGQLPFPAEDWPTLAQRVQVGEFTPVHALRPELPAALDIWFRDMLQPQLPARFAGAEPARLALERVVRAFAPRPVRSGPPPLPRGRPALVRPASVQAFTEAGAMSPAEAQPSEQSVASALAELRASAARLAECAPSVVPHTDPAPSATSVTDRAPAADRVSSTALPADRASSAAPPADGASSAAPAADRASRAAVAPPASGAAPRVERVPGGAPRVERVPGVAPDLEPASSAVPDAARAPRTVPDAERAPSARPLAEDGLNVAARERAAQDIAAPATQSAAQLANPVTDEGKPAGSEPASQLTWRPVPVIAAVVERSAGPGKSTPPAAPQGVRVGTLLLCGLLLVLVFACVLALRPARMNGLPSQAASAESARPVARTPSQPPLAVAPSLPTGVAVEPASSVAAPPQPMAPAEAQSDLQLSAAAEPQPQASVEPSPPLPAAAIAPISTPVAAERLRSRSAGARLSQGPAALPLMVGGPREKPARKPLPAPPVPEAVPELPPPAPSAPPPAANRPYRGF